MHPAISSSMYLLRWMDGGWCVLHTIGDTCIIPRHAIVIYLQSLLSLVVGWRWYYYDRDETESLEIIESENVHHDPRYQFSIYNAYLRKH